MNLLQPKTQLAQTSATSQVRPRALGVVFGGHLSAQAAFRLDLEYSEQSAPAFASSVVGNVRSVHHQCGICMGS